MPVTIYAINIPNKYKGKIIPTRVDFEVVLNTVPEITYLDGLVLCPDRRAKFEVNSSAEDAVKRFLVYGLGAQIVDRDIYFQRAIASGGTPAILRTIQSTQTFNPNQRARGPQSTAQSYHQTHDHHFSDRFSTRPSQPTPPLSYQYNYQYPASTSHMPSSQHRAEVPQQPPQQYGDYSYEYLPRGRRD